MNEREIDEFAREIVDRLEHETFSTSLRLIEAVMARLAMNAEDIENAPPEADRDRDFPGL